MAHRSPPAPDDASHFVSAASLRRRLEWFDRLRWVAVVCVVVATLVADGVLPGSLPVGRLLAAAAVLAVLNAVYTVRNLRVPPTDLRVELRHVKLQMVGDLFLLTVMLNFSGGIENPLLFMYLIHVIIASLLFKGREVFQIAWLAIFLLTADVAGEHLGLLAHHHLLSASPATHQLPFILLTLGSFWLVLLFAAYIGSSIMKHNRAIKDELVQRQRELVVADRAKLDFFRFVTHEIKSPVATAQSAVQAALELGEDDLPDQVKDLLGRAVGRLNLAIEMVKDLADFTRGGDLKRVEPAEIDLNVLIARIVDGQLDEAARRNVTINMSLPSIQPHVVGHAGMLEKIVRNLVSNAVRYSEPGGRVDVGLDLAPREYVLKVADQGIGIAPEDQEKIFDEFYRTRLAQDMSNLGTGLGLAIVRKFTEELGGTVTLESEPGRGSTFTVTIPRTGDTNPPREEP